MEPHVLHFVQRPFRNSKKPAANSDRADARTVALKGT